MKSEDWRPRRCLAAFATVVLNDLHSLVNIFFRKRLDFVPDLLFEAF